MPPLHAHCLGRFTITHNSTPIRFTTDRAQALLATLLHHAPEPQRRDYLAYLMWPERPDQLARQNFRKTLSRLRQATAPYDIILSDYHTVQLNPAVIHSDLAEFRQALAGDKPTLAQLTHAADLYQGEFLHGFHLQDNPAFGEWLLLTREAWQRQARDILQQLIGQHIQAGQHPLAIPYAQRYVQMEPWDEAMHRTLLAALAATGQRAEALAHYHTYTAALQTELGIPPEPETVQLGQQLEQDKPLTAAQPVWHGFPIEQTTFVGRTAEIEQIHTLVTQQAGALVTLTGMGGMGKTRLACQAAQSLNPAHFPDGIYFVACSAVQTPADFLPHLISQLGLTLDGSRPTDQQLAHFLAHHPRLLLLLDNFEQLSSHAADLLAPLRHAQISLIVTSRHALNLQGEQRLSLRGLLEADGEAGEALFVARARRYEIQQFTPAEHKLIRELVQLVTGMPLAIEMAAGWLRAYDLPTLLQFLQQNISLWIAPHGDAPPRHQSLEAVFNGSWQLLSPALQPVLARLSLLQGTFTASAAHHISRASFLDVAQLVDRSLLAVGRDGRYHTHPLLRQLAQAKLAQMGEDEAANTAERHGRYYLALLERVGKPLRGADSQTAVRHIRQEYDNIRAGWVWAMQHLERPVLERAATPLGNYFLLTGLYAEGASLLAEIAPLPSAELWLERGEVTAALALLQPLLADPHTPPITQLHAHALLCAAATQSGRMPLLEQAVIRGLPLAAAHPQTLTAAYFYIQATLYYTQIGEPATARPYIEQAIPLFYETDDLWGASKALYAKAVVDGITNRDARPLFHQILHIQKQIGSLALQHNALHNLALGNMLRGDYVSALALAQEALAIAQQLHHDLLIAESVQVEARIQQRLGNWALAEAAYEQVQSLAHNKQFSQLGRLTTVYRAQLAHAQGQRERALALCHEAVQEGQSPRGRLVDGLVDWLRGRMAADEHFMANRANAQRSGRGNIQPVAIARQAGRCPKHLGLRPVAAGQNGRGPRPTRPSRRVSANGRTPQIGRPLLFRMVLLSGVASGGR
jgi:DNA-binding SARP family transcriptional activator/predicted ATPase